MGGASSKPKQPTSVVPTPKPISSISIQPTSEISLSHASSGPADLIPIESKISIPTTNASPPPETQQTGSPFHIDATSSFPNVGVSIEFLQSIRDSSDMQKSYFSLCFFQDDIHSISPDEFAKRALSCRLFSNLTYEEEQTQCQTKRNKEEWIEIFSKPPVTMTHVKCGIVVPTIKRIMETNGGTSGSYATLVIAKQNSNQIGIPTDFVSHAWRNSFANFVAALEIEAAARNESNRFYWNDVFVEDQVDADKKPEDYFFNAFKTAVATINRTVLVLDPLKNPIPLSRAWCVWEIYSTVSEQAELVVALPPSEQLNLENVLLTEFAEVKNYLSSVDSQTSDAYGDAKDKIHRIIQEKLSFNAVDSAVTKALRKWLSEAGLNILKSKSNDPDSAEEYATLFLMNQIGAMLFENHDDFVNAEIILQQALSTSKIKFGDTHDLTLVLMSNLAALFKRKGDILKAEELYKIVLLQRKTNKNNILQHQTALNNLAAVLQEQSKFGEAEELYMKVLNLGLDSNHVVIDVQAIHTLSVDDFKTEKPEMMLKTLNNLGTLCELQKKMGQAKTFYELVIKVVDNSDKDLTEKETMLCKVRGNLGKCCYRMGNFDAAQKYLKEALKQQTKLYGKNHRNSIATVSYLGEVLMQAKQFEQAYPLMLEQLEQSKLMDEQQGIEMSEKSASFAYKCSVCLGHRNSLKEAIELLRPLIETMKQQPELKISIKIQLFTLLGNFLQKLAKTLESGSKEQYDLYSETTTVLSVVLKEKEDAGIIDEKTQIRLNEILKVLEQLDKRS